MFVNNTSVYDVEKRITEKVVSEFIGRGKYKVEPTTVGVDAILLGEISSITLAPSAFTEERLASRYVLTVTARIEFKDVKADKVLWSNPSLQFREEFDVDQQHERDRPQRVLRPERQRARPARHRVRARPSSAPSSKRSERNARRHAARRPQADRRRGRPIRSI